MTDDPSEATAGVPPEIDQLSMEESRALAGKLVEFNASQVPFTQSEPFVHLRYGIKGADGDLLGGIVAVVFCWRCLYVEVLWVTQEHRGEGYGSRLLEKVETEAKRLGCGLAHLDTFDFQAKGFYAKHGYGVFGELDECPPGHQRLFMSKPL